MVRMLTNDAVDDVVSAKAVDALGKLSAAALALHARHVVAVISSPTAKMRKAAIETLGKLSIAALAKHAEVVVMVLADESHQVRYRGSLEQLITPP